MIKEHEEVNMEEDDEYVFRDSCATYILRDQSYVESFTYSGGVIISLPMPMHSCLVLDLADMVRYTCV